MRNPHFWLFAFVDDEMLYRQNNFYFDDTRNSASDINWWIEELAKTVRAYDKLEKTTKMMNKRDNFILKMDHTTVNEDKSNLNP